MFCDSSVVIRSFLLHSLVTLLLSCTLPVSAAQDIHWSIIGSETSSNELTACNDVPLDISGGVPPFHLLALPVEGQASMHALIAHGDAWTWQTDLDAGPQGQIALSIIDSQGLHADAQIFTVKGNNQACSGVAPEVRTRASSPPHQTMLRRSIGSVNSQLPLILGACIGVTVFLILSTGMLFGIWFQRRRQRREWDAGMRIGMQPMRGSVSKPVSALGEQNQTQDAYSRPFVVKNIPKLRVDLAESPPNVSTLTLPPSSADLASPTDSVPPLPAIASAHGAWAISPEWQHVFEHPHTVPGITDSLFTSPFQQPPRRGSEPTTVLARDLPPPQPAHLVTRHLSISGYDSFHSQRRHVAPMLVSPVLFPSTIRRSVSPVPVAGPSSLAPRGSVGSTTTTLTSPSSSRLEKQRLVARDRELARQEREQQQLAQQRKRRTELASGTQLPPQDRARRLSLGYDNVAKPHVPTKLVIPSSVRPLPQLPQSAPAQPAASSFEDEQESLLAAAARRGQMNALTAVRERRLRHMHSAGDIRAAVRAQQRDLVRGRELGREQRELARHLSMIPPQPRVSEGSTGSAGGGVRVPETALSLSPPPPYSLNELALSRILSAPR